MTNILYNPFFDATKDVFQLMLDLNNITNKPLCETCVVANGKMDIAIGVVGDMQGKVIYRFPVETSLEIVKIMSGMEFSEIDDFVTSAMGEIANIISGNVLSILSVQEITCDILPPQILTEDMVDDSNTKYDYISGMQIYTDIGNISLDIMLNTAKK